MVTQQSKPMSFAAIRQGADVSAIGPPDAIRLLRMARIKGTYHFNAAQAW